MWPFTRRLDCRGKCCYRCAMYEKFNEGYKVAAAQADELRARVRHLEER